MQRHKVQIFIKSENNLNFVKQIQYTARRSNFEFINFLDFLFGIWSMSGRALTML